MKIILLCCCLILSSCALDNTYRGQKEIYEVLESEFIVQKFHTSTFTLYGLLRPARNNSDKLHVYIEGDGLAWLSRNRPSTNPTPTDNVTPTLAKNDPNDAAILYLARPCQYVEDIDKNMCEKKFWTSHRLAPEVIEATNEAINQAKKINKSKDVAIIGYSGGGGVAVLASAEREDVVFLGTIAGLLDHKKWTDHHKISPLHGSLNPIDKVELINDIPQRHASGMKDTIIPPVVNKNFCQSLTSSNSCLTFDKLSHNDNWYQQWSYFYK